MTHFVISKQNLIQKALSIKKEVTNQKKVILTEKQVEEYIDLVIEEIKKLQQKTNTFTFEVVDHNRVPTYNPITKEVKDAITNTTIYYDQTNKLYSSYNSANELNLAHFPFIPFGLKACLTPIGYMQVLDIPKPNINNNKRYKKASVQSDLTSSSKNEDQAELSQ